MESAMFSASAEFYDLIYKQFKNFPAEADLIAKMIQQNRPQANMILDVACGTGEHAKWLSLKHGFRVDGIDIEPEFIRIASRKNPQGTFQCQKMQSFSTGRLYDVIICLFSSIGYAKTLADVTLTLKSMHRHLKSDGLALIEPWFQPGALNPDVVHLKTVEKDDLKICRMSHLKLQGNLSTISFEYLIGSAQGITHKCEVHELGLFTEEEMKTCFFEAGFMVDFDPHGPYGRGIYLARPQ